MMYKLWIVIGLLLGSIYGQAQINFVPKRAKPQPPNINNRVVGRSAETDKKDEIALQLKVTTDMDGTVWINDKSYKLTTKEELQIGVPMNINYYFVNSDITYKTEAQRKTFAPDERGKVLALHIEASQAYEDFVIKSNEANYRELILNTIEANMIAIVGGKMTSTVRKGLAELDSFEIGRYEVTVGQFALYARSTQKKNVDVDEGSSLVVVPNSLAERIYKKAVNWKYDPLGLPVNVENYNHPVINVSWYEAMGFCEWLSGQNKYYNYRLPTADEWAFAAGCGDYELNYPWGDSIPTPEVTVANVADFALLAYFPLKKEIDADIKDDYPFISEVGKFEPNCYGIFDMCGNVAEWCIDDAIPFKPLHENDKSRKKVHKGGSYFTGLQRCLVKENNYFDADKRHSAIGFRIVREWKK